MSLPLTNETAVCGLSFVKRADAIEHRVPELVIHESTESTVDVSFSEQK